MRHGLVSTTVLILLALSMIPSALAGTELAYDDGTPESSITIPTPGISLAVKFSLPDGCSKASLLTARFYKMPQDTNVIVHILGSDGLTELTTPFTYDIAVDNSWNDADLHLKNIAVTGDFWIAIEYTVANDPNIGFDTSSVAGRSYSGVPGFWNPQPGGNIMIRAVIECSAPVGGVVMPVNKSLVLAPYLALAGLVAAVSAVVIVRKRHEA